MNPSAEDELAEIEQSARGEFSSPPTNASFNHTAAEGNRATPSTDSAESYILNDFERGDLLVAFPSRGEGAAPPPARHPDVDDRVTPPCSSGKAKQRNSINLNQLSMGDALAGLADLADSDDDDHDDDSERAQNAKPPPPPPPVSNPTASGGPDHRPLVGGCAAAAYEAARVDYYNKQGKDVRGHGAPHPRAKNDPRCPRYPPGLGYLARATDSYSARRRGEA